MRAKKKARSVDPVDDGYAGGYVSCKCGSRRVQLFTVRSAGIYHEGRLVERGGRAIGVRVHCLTCKKSARFLKGAAT